MILKSILYKKEQEELCDKIIDIIQLDNQNCITLYELDNNQEKQNKIMELLPELRKYFSYEKIRGVKEPETTKRPWLSIIRQISKLKYQLLSSDFRITENGNKIRTKKYIFMKST